MSKYHIVGNHRSRLNYVVCYHAPVNSDFCDLEIQCFSKQKSEIIYNNISIFQVPFGHFHSILQLKVDLY